MLTDTLNMSPASSASSGESAPTMTINLMAVINRISSELDENERLQMCNDFAYILNEMSTCELMSDPDGVAKWFNRIKRFEQ